MSRTRRVLKSRIQVFSYAQGDLASKILSGKRSHIIRNLTAHTHTTRSVPQDQSKHTKALCANLLIADLCHDVQRALRRARALNGVSVSDVSQDAIGGLKTAVLLEGTEEPHAFDLAPPHRVDEIRKGHVALHRAPHALEIV